MPFDICLEVNEMMIDSGNLTEVQALIDRGVQLNRKYEGSYPLHHSIRQNLYDRTFEVLME